MSEISATLKLPYIQAAQAQKHLTHNEAIAALDQIVQLSVLDDVLTAPPASVSEGDRYIVADGATGDWAGQDQNVACYDQAAWVFTEPKAGFVALVLARNALMSYQNGQWSVIPAAPITSVSALGIGTAQDSNNVLSVKGASTLLSGDNGGHRLTMNKDATNDTASLLFQTGWSGRAEMGTTGSDSFALKVSDDGSSWVDAISADPSGGYLTLQSEMKLTPKTHAELRDPAVAGAGTLAFISNATTGNELIYSDGSVWRRVRNGGTFTPT